MSAKTIGLFHLANPKMRVVVTVREPVARMYSYFSMQLRFGWYASQEPVHACMQVTVGPGRWIEHAFAGRWP